MHPSSMSEMKTFAMNYANKKTKVLDVGSYDVNGSYKELFSNYTGLDIVKGPNVDVVTKKPYSWPLKKETFDIVISGQALEHIEFPDKIMGEIKRVLKPGGYCCIIAPSAGPKHDYPVDFHRFDKASFTKLADNANLKIEYCAVNNDPPWYDVVLIAQKKK